MGTHARRIGLVNDLCRSCRDEEEKETVPHLLGICPAICRIKYMGVCCMDDLEALSRIDIGKLNGFIRSSDFLDGQPPLPTYPPL